MVDNGVKITQSNILINIRMITGPEYFKIPQQRIGKKKTTKRKKIKNYFQSWPEKKGVCFLFIFVYFCIYYLFIYLFWFNSHQVGASCVSLNNLEFSI